jgi:mycothiol synthase
MAGDEARIEVVGRLDQRELEAVTWLIEAATDADGVRPLSEHVALHLRYGGDEPVRNVLAWAPRADRGGLAAYAHLDVTDVIEGASAEVVVHPAMRRRGYGRAVVETLVAESPDGRLRLWAHGSHPGASALARSMGLEQMRELWQMRRSLFARLPDVTPPAGVVIRAFRPGEDEQAWVALNRRVFAGHPEQGSWTVDDLRRRMKEPWFDPEGFFLAESDGRLVGFHWTKVHGGSPQHGHDPIGEVYVVGVDPGAQGAGLGRVLTVVGLRHLRHLGLPAAMLYVDADNRAAIRVYSDLGFQRWDVDLMFRRAAPGTPQAGAGASFTSQ